MKVLNINTIKGIWRFLNLNKKIREKCGLNENVDRTTLNRRLSNKIKGWF